jgi:hypothetical protein
MRYIKYSKILTFCLFSLILSFIQCNKETGFDPYPCIKGQVTNARTKEPIEDAKVRLWIKGSLSDTLTYFTDSVGIYSTERINNWFNKSLTIEASKIEAQYTPVRLDVSPDILSSKMSITSDTLYINFEIKTLFAYQHSVIPGRLDFPVDGQYTSYLIILNESSVVLYWEIGENNTEWMSIYWWEVYNTTSDINHLKKWGFVKFKVRIYTELLTPGTYDSSILIITDQGNTIIPVHVTIN